MSRETGDDASSTLSSLWQKVNPLLPQAVPLKGRLSVDVLIVGAGLAGLSLGVHLTERKSDTVILEAENDSGAATSASAGIVAPQLVRTTPNAVQKRLGGDAGGRLLRMIADSGRYTFELIRHMRIDCSATQSGFLNPVAGRQATERHAQLVEEWRPFRDDLRLIHGADVRVMSGCRGYSSALIDSTGGGLDPLAYSRGLANAIRAGGVPIFSNSRVLSLTRSGDRWMAQTASGEVIARRVVLCANGGNAALHPALARTVLPLLVCEVATQPLPASMRERILPYGHTLTDSSNDIFSIRFDGMGRLITACPGRRKIDYAQVNDLINRRLETLLPDYHSTPLEHIWQGTAWLNSSLLPRVLLVDEGLMAVQACNGRGIALNTIIGMELAKRLADESDKSVRVPFEHPVPVGAFMIAKYLPKLMLGGAGVAGRTLRRFSWRT